MLSVLPRACRADGASRRSRCKKRQAACRTGGQQRKKKTKHDAGLHLHAHGQIGVMVEVAAAFPLRAWGELPPLKEPTCGRTEPVCSRRQFTIPRLAECPGCEETSRRSCHGQRSGGSGRLSLEGADEISLRAGHQRPLPASPVGGRSYVGGLNRWTGGTSHSKELLDR